MNQFSFSELLRAYVPGIDTDIGFFDPGASLSEDDVRHSAEAVAESRPSPSGPRRRRWQRHARRVGRPTLLTEELADRLYESILESGFSDTRAARRAGISPSAVSQWKREDPIFADFLETARAKYDFAQIRTIRDTARRDGRDDVRNAKWLLQFSNPEVYGGRPRKRSVAPRGRPRRTTRSGQQIDKNETAQQSNYTQNIAQTPRPVSSAAVPSPEPAARTAAARSTNPEWEPYPPESDTHRAAVRAEIEALKTARLCARQQSKCMQNIAQTTPLRRSARISATPAPASSSPASSPNTNAIAETCNFAPLQQSKCMQNTAQTQRQPIPSGSPAQPSPSALESQSVVVNRNPSWKDQPRSSQIIAETCESDAPQQSKCTQNIAQTPPAREAASITDFLRDDHLRRGQDDIESAW